MRRGELAHAVTCNAWGAVITLPAGTHVHTVKNGRGTDEWVIANVPLLVELIGNAHDPTYRFLFIDEKHVTEKR